MKKNLMRVMAAAFLLSMLFSSAAFAQGWERVGAKWYYWLEDGTCAKSTWITAADGVNRYWINSDGVMAAAQWIETDGVRYYADNNGNLLKNYLLDASDGKTYWLDESGVMAHDTWIYTEDAWYYMDSDGAAYTKGWHNIDGEDYYFLPSKKLAVNCVVPGGGFVGPDGRRIVK